MDRLFRPRSIAVIGGGAWCESVVRRCRDMGFDGPVWPVHPRKSTVGGIEAIARLEDLPQAPDAVFIGINRHATVEAVRILAAMGAGGAVCFASGFAEARAELEDGDSLQAALLQAAGDMPVLGPNCYGFINYLDGALLWPDEQGAIGRDTGVAILTQSSNIAVNITMQRRGVPLAYVVTAGNQAQTGLAAIGATLLADPRVTALGMYIEGIGDLRAFEDLAARARALGKRIVVVKAGASDHARAATVSHTASLAGSDAGARALLARLGIVQVGALSVMLEALKILHVAGPLASNRIASMSCSGGEASLMADSCEGTGLEFPPLNTAQKEGLRAALGPKVALANPLDYHTYIWGDGPALQATFTAMMDPGLALGCIILDFPRPDRCVSPEWDKVIEAARAALAARGVPMAIVSSLPENLPEAVCEDLVATGVIPLCGLAEAVAAITALIPGAERMAAPVLLPKPPRAEVLKSEQAAKRALSRHGLRVPGAGRATSPRAAAEMATRIGFPVVLKGEGVAHKTEAGAVVLNLATARAVEEAARAMPAEVFLVEEMITHGLAELLIGVVLDPAHGYLLTLAAGGVLTELLTDSAMMLLPVTRQEVEAALKTLRMAPQLSGYRGAAPVDMEAVLDAVIAVQDYIIAHQGAVSELEINPLICKENAAIAVDALIKGEEEDHDR